MMEDYSPVDLRPKAIDTKMLAPVKDLGSLVGSNGKC